MKYWDTDGDETKSDIKSTNLSGGDAKIGLNTESVAAPGCKADGDNIVVIDLLGNSGVEVHYTGPGSDGGHFHGADADGKLQVQVDSDSDN